MPDHPCPFTAGQSRTSRVTGAPKAAQAAFEAARQAPRAETEEVAEDA